MRYKRSLGLISVAALAVTLAACGSSNSSSTATGASAKIGDCDLTSKADSISLTPVKAGTLTV